MQPSWAADGGWRLSEAALLQIGAQHGHEAEELFGVRDAERLQNGQIVVVNSGAHELRLYSSTGQYVRAIGRQGPGPGELESPSRVWRLPQDSLAVLSFLKLSVFDSLGGFAHSIPIPGWTPHDRFSDGSYLWLVIPPGKDPVEPGHFHPDYALVRSAANGEAADTLAYVSGDEMFRSVSAGGVSSWYAPFGAVRMAATYGESIYTGDGLAFEVWEIDSSGVVVRILRRRADRIQVTSAAVDSFEAAMLEGTRTDAQRRTRARLFREWSYPSFRPAYSQLSVDVEGNVWVRHHTIGSEHSVWTVFDPRGHWLGDVEMPPGLAVKRIGPDFVLGVMTDELGVERVRLIGLEKHVSGSR